MKFCTLHHTNDALQRQNLCDSNVSYTHTKQTKKKNLKLKQGNKETYHEANTHNLETTTPSVFSKLSFDLWHQKLMPAKLEEWNRNILFLHFSPSLGFLVLFLNWNFFYLWCVNHRFFSVKEKGFLQPGYCAHIVDLLYICRCNFSFKYIYFSSLAYLVSYIMFS